MDLLARFIFTEWSFPAPKTSELHKWLTSGDQDDYNLELKELSWPVYFNDLTLGVRRYLSKESPKSLEAAKKKDTM